MTKREKPIKFRKPLYYKETEAFSSKFTCTSKIVKMAQTPQKKAVFRGFVPYSVCIIKSALF
jgi:hypothetical protein